MNDVNATFARINTSKANFDDIYTMDDPRGYFSVLGSLDYMIPDVAQPIVRQILDACATRRGCAPVVLDVGCSYGINAAVQRFPLSFDMLRGRYARHEMLAVTPEALALLDRNYYASWPETGTARFIGLDVSLPAVRYARTVGLIDDGVVADLERTPLERNAVAVIRRANVILSTGAVGYVTEQSYRRILDAMDAPPWIISFVLRMFPYGRFESMLDAFGLVTERLGGASFVQRRFRDVDELENTLDALSAQGIDPTGFESDGLLHAELFLSRPAGDARATPLDELVTVSSGSPRALGTRYVQVETDEGVRIALEP